MLSLKYALRFISECIPVIVRHTRLMIAGLFLIMGSFLLLGLGFVPVGVSTFLFGLGGRGMALIGLFSALTLFGIMIWAEVASIKISQSFQAVFQTDSAINEVDEQKRSVMKQVFDVITLAIARPTLSIIYSLKALFGSKQGPSTTWLDGNYLLVPVIALEKLELSEALERIRQVERDHLVRFNPALIGIGPVSMTIRWALVAIGALSGAILSMRLVDPFSSGVIRRILGTTAGWALAGFFAIAGIAFSSFIKTCYHTTLYQWVVNVESARRADSESTVSAPLILQHVLKKRSKIKKGL